MPELVLRGRRVAYLEQGRGVPLVLLHAGGSSGKQWIKTASFLADRFRVIAPDRWGFGLTEGWPGDERLTHDHQALLVATVIEQVAAGPAHLVGHSYGGLNNPTSLQDVRQIGLPTLVMCGEKTTPPDRRVTEILREQMPRCRYTVIPGADHMSPLSHPEFIANAVRDHVEGEPPLA